MAEMTAEMDQIQVPDGGVASFMMSDEDIANLEREEDQQLAEEVYGGEGISQFTDMAAQMAGLGRFGDDVIVHAQTGELVIPKKILDDNPEIKQMVFEQLMAQGVEDPEQYVVGSGSASINPETGLAEYGFGSFFKPIRRVVSKVAKGVKKVASKVVKVAKKVAPIVLPIAMTMLFPALGPIYGAALGSGIGTLIQGGSFKDALKSAAISGLTGAAFQGFTGPGTFSQNVGAALEAPGARFAQVGGQLKSGFSGQGFNFGQKFAGASSGLSPSGEAPADYRGSDYQGVPDSAFDQVNNPGLSAEQIQARDLSIANAQNNMSGYSASGSGAPQASMAGQANMTTSTTSTGAGNNFGGAGGGGAGGGGAGGGGQSSFIKDAKNYYNKANDFLTIGEAPKSVNQILLDSNINPANATLEQVSMATNIAKNQAGTGIVSGLIRNAPKIGLGYAVAKKSGVLDDFFETPEPTPEEDSPLGVKQGPTGYERFMADQDQFMVNTATVDPIYTAPLTQYVSYSDFYNPSTFALPSSRPREGGPFYRPPVQTAAQGGEIFPRRTGGIMPDEGIPGKDSVRAMLMPGEFVMTTDAVKGMGDGNLRRGIQNMYGVMANLEKKGRMA